MSAQKPPSEYAGEMLCPRCASGFAICTDGFTHEESCRVYRFSMDVCAECNAAIVKEALA